MLFLITFYFQFYYKRGIISLDYPGVISQMMGGQVWRVSPPVEIPGGPIILNTLEDVLFAQ